MDTLPLVSTSSTDGAASSDTSGATTPSPIVIIDTSIESSMMKVSVQTESVLNFATSIEIASVSSTMAYNLDCFGLTFPLTKSPKQLVVGRQYLPLSNLRSYSGSSYMWTPLAKIKRDSGFGGDFAFKKAFSKSSWPEDLNGTACKSSREEYTVSSLDNHLYTQHSFQPAYTSSVMWLFQYGTANDVISISEEESSLAFAANVITNGVIMSTPTDSSYLTYAACSLIMITTLWVTLKSHSSRGIQSHRSVSAHAVTDVLLNTIRYPPAFVNCVVNPPEKSYLERVGSGSLFATLKSEPEQLRAYIICGVAAASREPVAPPKVI